jgi:protein-tyrosine phosphatase
VFICDGNICRSAYAAARAKKMGLPAVSGGLRATQDGPADPKAIKMAALRGIELASHRTRPAAAIGGLAGDLYLCMEPRQARSIAKLINRGPVGQVSLLGLWSHECRPFLQDPYGLREGYWHTCFDLIDSAVRRIALEIAAFHPNHSDASSELSRSTW